MAGDTEKTVEEGSGKEGTGVTATGLNAIPVVLETTTFASLGVPVEAMAALASD